MSKPLFIISCPVDTYSGYGARARDIVKAIIATDRYDVKLLSQRWGNTRFGYLKDHNDTELSKRIVEKLEAQPDVWMQITVPNEFQKKAKFSIGITAGIESTIAPKEWIDGCNKMDLVIVPTEFSKKVLLSTIYDETDKRTNQVVRQHKITTPIEVLHEGVELETFLKLFSKLSTFSPLTKIPLLKTF